MPKGNKYGRFCHLKTVRMRLYFRLYRRYYEAAKFRLRTLLFKGGWRGVGGRNSMPYQLNNLELPPASPAQPICLAINSVAMLTYCLIHSFDSSNVILLEISNPRILRSLLPSSAIIALCLLPVYLHYFSEAGPHKVPCLSIWIGNNFQRSTSIPSEATSS